MAADDAAGSSRRMDLNLYLGLPRAPRARRPDLGSDLALGTPMLSSSSPSSSAASADALPLETDPPHRADLLHPLILAHEPYNPFAPEVHPPYVPPPPLPVPGALPVLADKLEFGFPDAHLGLVERLDRPSSSTASSSFRPDRAEHYRRLMSLSGSRYFRPRRLRSDLPPLSSEIPSLENDAAGQPPEPEEPVHDTVEANKVVVADGAVVGRKLGVSEDDGTEHGKSAAMFECNICFEMADEPIVTSCVHLFCWPCLYQWLHVHSSHKECPVCKAEVTEGNITPIFGRGNSGSDMEKKVAEDGNASGPKIPPRPHGNQLESFRQQFHHLRPISRRLGEAHGFLSTWRHILDQHLVNSMSRFEGPPELSVVETAQHQFHHLRPISRRLGEAHGFLSTWRRILDQHLVNSMSTFEGPAELSVSETAQHACRLGRMTTRLRARRLQREAENSTSIVSYAQDSGHQLRRIDTAVNELRRITRPSPYGASTSSNPPNPEPIDRTHIATPLAADQASNLSRL